MAESSRSYSQHGWILVRALFWIIACQLLAVFLVVESRERKQALSWFLQGHQSVHECSTLMTSFNPIYFSNALPPNIITWKKKGRVSSIWVLGGIKQSITANTISSVENIIENNLILPIGCLHVIWNSFSTFDQSANIYQPRKVMAVK